MSPITTLTRVDSIDVEEAPATIEDFVDGDGGAVSAGTLRVAMKHVLVDKDLERSTLKTLRRDVVAHLKLPKTIKRQLEGSRRLDFSEMAQAVIKDMQAGAPAPKPCWMVLEDEDASTSVYLVTLAAVLAETALDATTPLRTIEDLSREDVRDFVLDAISNPIKLGLGTGRPHAGLPKVVKMIVAKELPLHFHGDGPRRRRRNGGPDDRPQKDRSKQIRQVRFHVPRPCYQVDHASSCARLRSNSRLRGHPPVCFEAPAKAARVSRGRQTVGRS